MNCVLQMSGNQFNQCWSAGVVVQREAPWLASAEQRRRRPFTRA